MFVVVLLVVVIVVAAVFPLPDLCDVVLLLLLLRIVALVGHSMTRLARCGTKTRPLDRGALPAWPFHLRRPALSHHLDARGKPLPDVRVHCVRSSGHSTRSG